MPAPKPHHLPGEDPAFPFAWLDFDKAKMERRFSEMAAARIAYRMGGKVPFHNAVPGKDYKSLDCSGLVDELVWVGTGSRLDLPEGSWYEQEWVESQGFKQTTIDAGKLKDGIVRVAFLPKSRANNDRHVVLILDGYTRESSSGVGANKRLWNPTATNWMGRCDVYVLTHPGRP